ncbi:MAG: carboxyltransferase domain-containing protein [Pseudomonadota bacterium]
MANPFAPFPNVVPLGDGALLVRFTDRLDDAANRACLAFRAALEQRRLPGVQETASSLGSVLVRVASGHTIQVQSALENLLGETAWQDHPLPERTRWTIPCSFGGRDGPQLAEVAAMAHLTEAQAIDALCAAPTRVLALGFAPGMPYLGILPPIWDLPRQTGLTPKVPPGALVIAVRQFVLFGTEAPTGWRHVGRTLFDCFDRTRPRPIALTPGDEVCFTPVSPEALRAKAKADPAHHGGALRERLP